MSMRTKNKTVNPSKHPHILKELDRPPETCFATAWVLCHGRLFRVDFTIISPESEESQGNFVLSSSETKKAFEALPDIVKLLQEELR